MHIASKIELSACITEHISTLERVVHQAVRRIVTDIARRHPLSEALAKEEYDKAVQGRARELDFNLNFKG